MRGLGYVNEYRVGKFKSEWQESMCSFSTWATRCLDLQMANEMSMLMCQTRHMVLLHMRENGMSRIVQDIYMLR